MKYYSFLHEDKNVVQHSSSGGAFTLCSDYVLRNSGVVYGSVFDSPYNIKHIRATSKESRDLMRGSKYIQSTLNKQVFSQVSDDLNNNKMVLFSGTPCQIEAIKKYLLARKVSIEKLYTVEVICHGVGSNKFYLDYLHRMEELYSSVAQNVSFRGKNSPGQKQDMSITFKNGRSYHALSTKYDWFYSIYLQNLILRPSCYNCPFAKMDRSADISIADHWGFRDDLSYSLVVQNSPKGEELLSLGNGMLTEISEKEIHQPHMLKPCSIPKSRDAFWDLYLKHGYLAIQKQYGYNNLKGKILTALIKIAVVLKIKEKIKKLRKY